MSYDRSQVDLTNCDREPIHIPGSIQPHGAMIVLNEQGLVTFVSENIDIFLGETNRDYVETQLADVVGGSVAHDIANAVATAGPGHVASVLLKAKLSEGRHTADITVHRYEDRTFLEFEPPATVDDTEVALHLTQSLVRRVDGLRSFDSLFKAVARLVRAMLGYDRVMVYRFLHNGAGRVVAEAKEPSLNSFLGQHFPVSDIPVQARRLYVQNWIRIIGDASFAPVALVPTLADSEQPVDLSHAHLRSVSPIHCEYLRNMGVAASMSISIVVDGELWGLIACHHNTPKTLSIPLRVATELFAQFLSLHISAMESREQKAAAVATKSRLDAIISDVDPNDPVEVTLQTRLREFSSLIASDGAGLWSHGRWFSSGVVPSDAAVPDLMALIARKAGRQLWDTQDLRLETGNEVEYGSSVAGVLAIPISVSAPDFLVFFRSEEAHEIEWAGEPSKRQPTSTAGRLTPRGSFETWREDVRHRSLPWTEADLGVAEYIRNYVRDVMLSHNDATEEQRERTEEQRRMLNSELNHRVKNILALVKSIASQTGANADSVDEYAKSFEGRLRALSFAHDQSFGSAGGGELKTLIEAEAGMHRFGRTSDRVAYTGAPVALTERAFGVFALLLHEMMTNAAKYGSLSVPAGRLDIAWDFADNGDCHLSWIESGGPAVVPPARRGFGSNLIEKTVTHDLGGTIDIEYASQGLRANIVIPAAHLKPISQQQPSSDTVEVPVEKPAEGLDVLLVEDQSLIAMDTEELLLSLGAVKVTTSPSIDAALRAIEAQRPGLAVLDLNLGETTSEDVARELRRLEVPFVFATGYRDSVSIPDDFADAPVVRKPVSPEALATALSEALLRNINVFGQ